MLGSALLPRLGAIAFATFTLLAPLTAAAQVPSGSTLSPDLQSYMVSKDLGDERWTISLNLFSANPANIISVTGNIFRSDGGPASFVTCLVRADSQGSLLDDSSVFRLSCSGADACQTTAEQCARDGWSLINDDVLVPASFFLPPGGNGPTQVAGSDKSFDALLAYLRASLERMRKTALARAVDLTTPRSALAQSDGGRGATLTLDNLDNLVTKDVGGERWSISYSLEPFATSAGGVDTRFLSVTGNVYEPDGSPPSFVYCTVRDDSTGTLSDPTSEFRFRCQGANACTGAAISCAQSSWSLISDDVRLQASFFLPPGGLPASPQSDPDIVVIGRTSDPPSIGASESGSGQSARAALPAGTSCPVGDSCQIARIGSCQNLAGVVVNDSGTCACVVDPVPSSCIGCVGATDQCGASCQFAVNDSVARGTCLPFDSESTECICYAIGAGQELATQGCGGALGLDCPGDRCCANDPRGSCDPAGGQVSCPGVCVDANGCDPTVQQCGICLSPAGVPTATPRPSPTATPTPTPDATATAGPTPTPTPVPSPSPTATPISICLTEGEECLGQPYDCCEGLVCDDEIPSESFCTPVIP